MGVKDLWNLLRSVDLVTEYNGTEHHDKILAEVQGKVVAVDTSQWLFHANSQPELLANFSSPDARCLKVAFERAINWLRYGCVPVACIDGDVPAEKRELLRQRLWNREGREGGGTGNPEFQRLGNLVGKLLRAMGLSVFTAPGEAEALMAALEQAGLVDACATGDGDALVFGASTIYHTIKLQTGVQKAGELVCVDMPAIRHALSLQRGGADSLLAMALLTGGDYDVGGLAHVGKAGAMRVIAHLLKGHQDDEGIVDRLAEALAQPPDPVLEGLTQCTGCKRCKHASRNKSKMSHHSTRNPCPACPSPADPGLSQRRGDSGAKPRGRDAGATCQAREGPCECPFHAREEERRLDKVIRLAHECPGFAQRAATAQRGYSRQREAARAAVAGLPREKLKWLRRPDVDQTPLPEDPCLSGSVQAAMDCRSGW